MASATFQRAPALPTRIQVGLVGLLLGARRAAWARDRRSHERHGRGPGNRPRRARVVHRRMGDDDGRDDAAVGRADGGRPCAAPGGPARTGADRAIGANALFVAGYLVAWAAAGLLGYAIFDGVRSLDPASSPGMTPGRYVAGGVIVGAGLYQLTTPKDACLRHCRSPAISCATGTRVASARCGWGSSTAASASAAAGG